LLAKKQQFQVIKVFEFYNPETIVQHDAGPMALKCWYCKAPFFAGEAREGHTWHPAEIKFGTLCCNNGNIKLPGLPPLPPLLQNLYSGVHPKSRHFMFEIFF